VLDLHAPLLCVQIVADAVSMTTIVCQRKLDMPNSYVVDSRVSTIGLTFHQTSRPIS